MRTSTALLFLLCLFGSIKAQDTTRTQVHGIVVNAATGKGVVDALVEWYDDHGKRQAVTRSNADGRYALFLWSTGLVELRIDVDGFSPLRDSIQDLRSGEAAREHDLVMLPKP